MVNKIYVAGTTVTIVAVIIIIVFASSFSFFAQQSTPTASPTPTATPTPTPTQEPTPEVSIPENLHAVPETPLGALTAVITIAAAFSLYGYTKKKKNN